MVTFLIIIPLQFGGSLIRQWVVVLSVVAIFLLIRNVLNFSDFGNIFPALWAAIVLVIFIPQISRTPHTIIFDGLGNLTFKSLQTERVYSVNVLRSIGGRYLNTQYLYFQFDNGTVKVINSIDNLSELITNIKTINANIETRGR